VFKRHDAHIVWLKHNLNGQCYIRNENIGYKLWASSPFKSVLLGWVVPSSNFIMGSYVYLGSIWPTPSRATWVTYHLSHVSWVQYWVLVDMIWIVIISGVHLLQYKLVLYSGLGPTQILRKHNIGSEMRKVWLFDIQI